MDEKYYISDVTCTVANANGYMSFSFYGNDKTMIVQGTTLNKLQLMAHLHEVGKEEFCLRMKQHLSPEMLSLFDMLAL